MTSNVKRGLQNKFNRGEVSTEAFAREDVVPIDNSCELMENFQPQRLGPMMYRPGTELIDIATDNEMVLKEFITEVADPLLLIFGLGGGSPTLKVLRSTTDTLIARTSVTSTMQNQLFDSALTAGEWVDDDEGSATSVVDLTDDWLEQTGTGTDSAKVYQTLDSTETGEPHGFEVRVVKGSVLFQIGTTGADSADLFEGLLRVGIHHIEVTPDAALTVTISNDSKIVSHVTSCELLGNETTSILLEDALNASFVTSADYAKLKTLRVAQSADVLFFASKHFLPFVVKRWNATSYTLERFVNVYGPYDPVNISRITMNPTAPLDGDMQVVSSEPFFDSNTTFGFDKGTLLRMAVTGQTTTATGSDSNVETTGIFVFGSGDARKFTIDIDTTSAYTEVRLEKSFDEITWQKVKVYTSGVDVVAEVYNDSLDAAETYYRLQVEDIGSATTITLTLTYDYGTLEAQGRISTLTAVNEVSVEWYVPLTVDQTVRDWYAGSWGGKHEFPSAIAFYEGRLWFAGGNKIWGSETDFYASFDRSLDGASASVQRTIGFGSAEEILWIAPSARLVVGTATHEIDVRSTTFNELITDDNANLKPGSDYGVASVEPISLDGELLFVQRGGDKLISIEFSVQSEKHNTTDLNMTNTTVLDPGVTTMSYARNPETRIHMVMDDGTMRVLLRDPTESVLGWSRVELQRVIGEGRFADSVLDVAVLPGIGQPEDQIYVAVDVPGAVDMSTLSYADVLQKFDYSATVTSFGGFKFSPDLEVCFILDDTPDLIREYRLRTPGDFTTMYYTGKTSPSLINVCDNFTVKPDGTRVWCVYGSVVIASYTLSVAWDINTMTSDSVTVTDPDNIDTATPDMEDIYAIEWSIDGTKVYFLGASNEPKTYLYQFSAATAFDIETLTHDGSAKEIHTAANGGRSLAIDYRGLNWYVQDAADLSKVKLFTTATAWTLTGGVAGTSIDFATIMTTIDETGPRHLQLMPGDAGFIWQDYLIESETNTIFETVNIPGETSTTLGTNWSYFMSYLKTRVYVYKGGPTGERGIIKQFDRNTTTGALTYVAEIDMLTASSWPAVSSTLFISEDGTELVSGDFGLQTGDELFTFHGTMSTAWDITTLTHTSSDNPHFTKYGFAMKPTGGTIIFPNNNGHLETYNLSGFTQSFGAVDSTDDIGMVGDMGGGFNFTSITMNYEGTRFYVLYDQGGSTKVNVYILSTPWVMSSATLDGTIAYSEVTSGNQIWAVGLGQEIHIGETSTTTTRGFATATDSGTEFLYKLTSTFTASTQGKLLKFAQSTEAAGGNISKHFDSFMQFSSPGTTITLSANGGYIHGDRVGVWVDGADDGTYTVDSSLQITGVTSGVDVIVGYRYVADYLSNKLTGYDDAGVMNERKRILNTGLVMKDHLAGSVKVGPSLVELGNMPDYEDGTTALSGVYDHFPFPYKGKSETDPRLAIRATGPCKIMALSYDVKNTATKKVTSNTTVT